MQFPKIRQLLSLLCLPLMAASTSSCVLLLNAALSDRGDAHVTQLAPAAVAAPCQRLRVMTYNIAHGRGSGDRTPYEAFGGPAAEYGRNLRMSPDTMMRELDRIAQLIRDEHPDLVGLNEVDFGATWSAHVDQLKRLAQQTGMAFMAYGTKWDWATELIQVHCGNGVMSRFPISARNHFFDARSLVDWLVGDFSYLEVTVDGKHPFTLLYSHLDGPAREREQQAATFVGRTRTLLGRKVPVIIAGDLNAHTPAENHLELRDPTRVFEILLTVPELRVYAGIMPAVDALPLPSMHTSPRETIDHILVTKPFEFVRCWVPAVDYSDHRPLICDVRLTDCPVPAGDRS